MSTYIQLDVGVRYWGEAEINGEEGVEENTPFVVDGRWKPLIDLRTGRIIDWPKGVTAEFHYKVCDDGEYFLLDEDKKIIANASPINGYVPEGLCHGDRGHGDYIIFNVDGSGKIEDYKYDIDLDEWLAIDS